MVGKEGLTYVTVLGMVHMHLGLHQVLCKSHIMARRHVMGGRELGKVNGYNQDPGWWAWAGAFQLLFQTRILGRRKIRQDLD